jgi:hypothetical protein
MATRSGATIARVAFLLFALLSFFFAQVVASSTRGAHSHQHHHLHRQHGSIQSDTHAQNANTTGRFSGASNSTHSERLVAQAIAAMTVANKARVEKPAFNTNEFATEEQLAAGKESAPPLDLTLSASKGGLRRRKDGSTVAPYTISDELAAAAREIAESTPQIPKGDHADVAARVREKYRANTNDTNAPPREKRPEGRLGSYGKDSGASKRNAGYWMVDEASSGHAPLAGQDYKVCRS